MSIERMDAIITEYLDAKKRKNDAEKQEKALAALILAHAGVKDPTETAHFETGMYSVDIEPKKREGLDLDALRKDFPDISADYGKVSRWSAIAARIRTAAGLAN